MKKVTITVVGTNEPLQELSCSGGNWGFGKIVCEDSEGFLVVPAYFCRCHSGCGNTDRIPTIGMVFASRADLQEFMES